MKRALFIGIVLLLFLFQLGFAQIPKTISYQGVLTDTSGNPVTNGNYDFTFQLYDVASGGTSIWSETQSGVVVTNGIFNVILGSVNPLNLPFDNPYWLGITVGAGTELSPRIELTSSAYSLSASIADSGNTLGQAYDQGGPGFGRTIMANAGAVNIAGPDGLTIAGRVGIGTTTPGTELDIRGSNPDDGGGMQVANSDESHWLYFLSGRQNSPDHLIAWSDGDELSLGSYSTVFNERMRFTSTGNVGIGTMSPNEQLEVAGTISSTTGGFKFPDGSVQTTAATGGGGGDITAVTAGSGLSGGGTSGDVSLDVGAGTGINVSADQVSLNTSFTDGRYVEEGQVNSIATSMIQNNAVNVNKISSDIISSLDGVSNDGGNIDLVAGSNVNIVSDDVNNTITISSSGGTGGGDITAVNAGNGLTGGGTTGDVTLDVSAGTGITVAADQVSLNTTYTDGQYVNEGQTNSISGTMIQNDAVSAAKIAPNILSSLDGVSNDAGDIDLVAGSNITITPNDANNTITIDASGSSGNTLDQAYDQGGPGFGRTITADAGAVNINGPDGLTVTGKVGVGTTSPNTEMDIRGSDPDDEGGMQVANSDESHWLLFRSGRLNNPDHLIAWSDGDALRLGSYSTAFNESMRIISNGNVGIGTTNPTSKLHVNIPSGSGSILLNHPVAGDLSYDLKNVNTDYSLKLSGLNLRIEQTGLPRMTFNNAGNVGVGTTSPTEKLEVAGTISSTSGGIKFPDGTVQTTAATSSGGNTLDQAYDQGGLGAGRTINADAGSVEIAGPGGLTVDGGVTFNSETFLTGGGSEGGQLTLMDGDDQGGWEIDNYGGSGEESMRFFRDKGFNDVSNALVLKNTGKVGIGTNNPTADLHVSGIDGALFEGTSGSGTIPKEGVGTRMMWYPAKAAFRVGVITANHPNAWDADSIGVSSVAMGYNTTASGLISTALGDETSASGLGATAMGDLTKASGQKSTAMGRWTVASGFASMAFGSHTKASGDYSTAMGRSTKAEAYSSTSIGQYNIGGGNPLLWVAEDPIFEIGIGTSDANRANAITVLKNGKVGISTTFPTGQLHVESHRKYAGYFTTDSLSTQTHVIHGEFTGSGTLDVIGVYGKAEHRPYYGHGGYFVGGYTGVSAVANETGDGHRIGLHALGANGTGSNFGVFGNGSGGTTAYGIFGTTGGGTGSTNYAVYASGDLAYTGELIPITDANFQENIRPLTGSLSKVMQLKGRSFRFTQNVQYAHMNLPEGEHYGLIAQEVEEVLPELVSDNSHPSAAESRGEKSNDPPIKYKGLNYIEVIPFLVEAIKEQQHEIEELKAEISALKSAK